MPEHSLRNPVVEPALLMEAAVALADSPRALSTNDVERIVDRSGSYTESLIHLGKELNLIESEDDGHIIARSVRMQIRQSTEDQQKKLLNDLLQQYKPFVAFSSSLIQGSASDKAALQTDVVYQLEIEEEKIKDQFIKLGEYAGLFSEIGDNISTSFNTKALTDEYLTEISDAMNATIVARLFVENRLGDEVVVYLDEDTLNEIVNSMELFWERPRSAIAAAGRAVEDFQRDIGNDYGKSGTDYTKADGIGQVTQMLQSDGLIKKRHLHGGNYLAGMRNPSGGHGMDPEELERWDVSPEVAFMYSVAAIHHIRSLYVYVYQNRLVL